MMSEENSGELEVAEDNVGKIGEKVNCNGEILRTSDPLKDGSTSVNKRHMDTMNDEAACSSADTQWTTKDEQISSNSKDPTHNNHNSDSTSSEDEMEGQGDFAANWYEPLPQDPQESDEEEEVEESEQRSETAIGSGQPLQGKQDGEREEEEGEGQGASVQPVEEIQAASPMEDSQVEAIKQAMAGFSLPLVSQPQWARVVPENVWKAELIGGLQQKQRHKSKPKAKQKKT